MAPASAQASKITLVVPFPPGGSTDAMARLLQSNLQTKLNRIVVAENRSGAAGAGRQVLSEPATATQLKETRHMTLLLQDGAAFETFFDKQVAYWGKVVKDNNISA